MTATQAHPPASRKHESSVGLLSSGWLWGVGLTFGFYFGLPHLPFYRAEAERYFSAHWIEYATTGLFFVGMATLIAKSLRIPSEWSALESDVLVGLVAKPDQQPAATAEQIENHLRLVARQSARSVIVRRIRELCDYVRARCSADGLEAHLNYLAELASSRLHESYALIRTITWAVPILGFLGTVVGITMAIANVTPDQLSSSLNEVTAGLAVAFDTTALSLALSMILVFTTFLVERAEQRHLDGVEDFLVQRVTALFPATARQQRHPLFDAESKLAQQWIRETETLIHVQQEEWRQTLEGLRQRWCDTLERQQLFLAESLQAAATETLADHARQLADVRQELTAAILHGAQSLAANWADVQRQWQAEQSAARQELAEVWAGFRDNLHSASTAQMQQSERLIATLEATVADWQSDLRQATSTAAEQLEESRRHGEALARLVDQESELINLEERLSRHLESARAAESLEEAVLNLNAAVHLLSARTLPKAA